MAGAPEIAEVDDEKASSSSPVFIGYASQDAAVTIAFEARERRSIACRIAPRDVKPGALYADAIIRAINEAAT